MRMFAIDIANALNLASVLLLAVPSPLRETLSEGRKKRSKYGAGCLMLAIGTVAVVETMDF